VYETHITEVSKEKMPNIRRSLTIAEENDERVQQRRAMFLSIKKTPIDMDYTTTVNMLIELGDFLFKQNWANPTIAVDAKEIMSIISKYTFSTTLKEEALYDQYQDQLMRNFPRMIEIYQKVIATQQKQSLPEPQQTKQETSKKDKEYVR
jgi:hypothetical protein